MKPGKQNFLVHDKADQDESTNHYIHKLVVPQRIDIIPTNPKERKTIVKERKFNMKKSVFKDWKDDT
jgi:hypothetical protein